MINAFIVFDAEQETADGRGWKVTHWDDADAASVLSPTVEYYYKLSDVGDKTMTVTNKALTSNVATLTTSGNHGWVVGQTVTVSINDNVFDGTYVLTVASGNSLSYARTNTNVGSTAATGTVTAPIVARYSAKVTNKALTTNVVTLTTSGPHSFKVGDYVTVAISDTTFDGTYLVATVPTSTTFTYAKTATNVGSTAATGTAVTATSALSRLKDLFSADTEVISFFTAKAEETVLAANQATVDSTADASLAAEGLTVS